MTPQTIFHWKIKLRGKVQKNNLKMVFFTNMEEEVNKEVNK